MVFVFQNTERSVIISVILFEKKGRHIHDTSRNDLFNLRHFFHDLTEAQMIDTMVSENRGFTTETWLWLA